MKLGEQFAVMQRVAYTWSATVNICFLSGLGIHGLNF